MDMDVATTERQHARENISPPAAVKQIDLSETTFSLSMFRREHRDGEQTVETLSEKLESLRAEFLDRSGAELVFAKNELAGDGYFDRLPPLSIARQVEAAEIAVREISSYPKGYLRELGLETFGIFEACVSLSNDGYHTFDARYGGYLYFGLYNTENGAVAAYYSDAQLPLTIHHEIFHCADANLRGETSFARHFTSDDARFARAISGDEPYAAPSIAEEDLDALKERSSGKLLRDVVSAYVQKNPNEDQAETARYLMANLADSLVQIVEQPELSGSQRILHVLAEYERASENGPGIQWFVDKALGRGPHSGR